MDPNTALARLRELIGGKRNVVGSAEVVETFQGLDEWLSKGGFLPQDWDRQHEPDAPALREMMRYTEDDGPRYGG